MALMMTDGSCFQRGAIFGNFRSIIIWKLPSSLPLAGAVHRLVGAIDFFHFSLSVHTETMSMAATSRCLLTCIARRKSIAVCRYDEGWKKCLKQHTLFFFCSYISFEQTLSCTYVTLLPAKISDSQIVFLLLCLGKNAFLMATKDEQYNLKPSSG